MERILAKYKNVMMHDQVVPEEERTFADVEACNQGHLSNHIIYLFQREDESKSKQVRTELGRLITKGSIKKCNNSNEEDKRRLENLGKYGKYLGELCEAFYKKVGGPAMRLATCDLRSLCTGLLKINEPGREGYKNNYAREQTKSLGHYATNFGRFLRFLVFILDEEHDADVLDVDETLKGRLQVSFLNEGDLKQWVNVEFEIFKFNAFMDRVQFGDSFENGEEESTFNAALNKLFALLVKAEAPPSSDAILQYTDYPLTYYTLGLLFDENKQGMLCHPARANKFINAAKAFIRAGFLATILNGSESDSSLKWFQTDQSVNRKAQMCKLHTLHCGLGQFGNVSKMICDYDERVQGSVKINGCDLGCDAIAKALKNIHADMVKLRKSTLSFGVDLWEKNQVFAMLDGKQFVQRRAFGTERAKQYALGYDRKYKGWQVGPDAFFKKKFHTKTSGNLKPKAAIAYLKSCLEFEKLAMASLHYLTGNGNRATDEFDQLRYRCEPYKSEQPIGGSLFGTHVELYDNQCLLLHGCSLKNFAKDSHAHGKTALIPLQASTTREFLYYLTIVRPVAHLLVEVFHDAPVESSPRIWTKQAKSFFGLTGAGCNKCRFNLERWNCFLFVEGSRVDLVKANCREPMERVNFGLQALKVRLG